MATSKDTSDCFVVIIMIILCLQEKLVAIGNYCPKKEQIKRCSCDAKNKGLDILCDGANQNQLMQAMQEIGQTGKHATYLKLRRTPLNNLSSWLLSHFDVVHLTVHHCNITNIESDAFSRIANVTESLDLSENNLSKIPTKQISILTSLVSLDLNHNYIEVLHAEAFNGLVSLVRLSLYGNRIKTIDPYSFKGIGANLTRINLGGNQLQSFVSTSFFNLTTLERLEIHENQIKTIEHNTFEGISDSKSLDALNMAGNLLQQIPEKSFQTLTTLSSLDLEKNKIHYAHPDAFHGLQKSLEWLKLGNNLLSDIPTQALHHLTRLRLLDLKGNYITSVKKYSFNHFGSNLKFLHLENNKIKSIEAGSFDKLSSLEWISLGSNQLKLIPFEIFHPILNSLKVLDINGNPLECNCHLIWFKDWNLKKDDDTKAKIPNAHCFMKKDTSNKTFVTEIKTINFHCINDAHHFYSSLNNLTSILFIFILVIYHFH